MYSATDSGDEISIRYRDVTEFCIDDRLRGT